MIPTEFDNTLVGTELGDIGRLRQIASKFCPDDIKTEIREFVPQGTDELNLNELKDGFGRLLAGGDAFPPVNRESWASGNGFGIGIPETEAVKNLNYEESDIISIDNTRKDFPVLNQKVNGHDLIWFDNGATTGY